MSDSSDSEGRVRPQASSRRSFVFPNMLGAAAVLGTSSIALGAFGAHALRDSFNARQLIAWQTGVQYHLLHSVAMLALALYRDSTSSDAREGSARGRYVDVPAGLFTLGTVMFSGSLYLIALGGPRWLGPVTPLGGLCLMAGWASLLFSRRTSRKQ